MSPLRLCVRNGDIMVTRKQYSALAQDGFPARQSACSRDGGLRTVPSCGDTIATNGPDLFFRGSLARAGTTKPDHKTCRGGGTFPGLRRGRPLEVGEATSYFRLVRPQPANAAPARRHWRGASAHRPTGCGDVAPGGPRLELRPGMLEAPGSGKASRACNPRDRSCPGNRAAGRIDSLAPNDANNVRRLDRRNVRSTGARPRAPHAASFVPARG